jgi:hypothetical protein
MFGTVVSVSDSTVITNIRMIRKKIGPRILEENIGASLNPLFIPLQSVAYVVRSAVDLSDSANGSDYYGKIIGALAGAGIGWLCGETITQEPDNEPPSSNPYSSVGRGINNMIIKVISTGIGIFIGGYIGDSIAHPVRWVEQQFNFSDPADVTSLRRFL